MLGNWIYVCSNNILTTFLAKYPGSMEDITEVRDHYKIPYPAQFGSMTYPKPTHGTVYDNLQVSIKVDTC